MSEETKKIMKVIEDNLSLAYHNDSDGSVVFQLQLGGKSIGKALRLDMNWPRRYGEGSPDISVTIA